MVKGEVRMRHLSSQVVPSVRSRPLLHHAASDFAAAVEAEPSVDFDYHQISSTSYSLPSVHTAAAAQQEGRLGLVEAR